MSRNSQMQMGMPLPAVIRNLMIATVGYWFFVQLILESLILKSAVLSRFLSLVPEQTLFGYYFWQPLTYMFLHSSQVTHVLFNMLMLWFFGGKLAERWGSRFFLIYYIGSGVGAALIYVLGMTLAAIMGWTESGMLVPVQGASGAVFGLLLAYGMIFSEEIIYFFMLFPMKTKFFVMIMGFIEFANLLSSDSTGSDVAYLAHLGGLASGFLILQVSAFIQRKKWGKLQSEKNKKRSQLRLVVDNEDQGPNGPKGSGPKYWN